MNNHLSARLGQLHLRTCATAGPNQPFVRTLCPPVLPILQHAPVTSVNRRRAMRAGLLECYSKPNSGGNTATTIAAHVAYTGM